MGASPKRGTFLAGALAALAMIIAVLLVRVGRRKKAEARLEFAAASAPSAFGNMIRKQVISGTRLTVDQCLACLQNAR